MLAPRLCPSVRQEIVETLSGILNMINRCIQSILSPTIFLTTKGEVFLNFVVFNNKAVSIVNCVRPYVGLKARRSNCRAVGK